MVILLGRQFSATSSPLRRALFWSGYHTNLALRRLIPTKRTIKMKNARKKIGLYLCVLSACQFSATSSALRRPSNWSGYIYIYIYLYEYIYIFI